MSCDYGKDCAGDVQELEPKAIIGFDGSTINGLVVHPNGVHVLYPMGNKISIQEWETKKQTFLVGHTNNISAVCISPSGKFVASGQINHIGFKARVIIWDFEKQVMLNQHEHHKVRVETVVFSKDERYLISLGGRDCGSLVIWDMTVGHVVCGAHASRGSQGEALALLPMMRRGQCFISAGDCHLSIWTIDFNMRSLRSIDVAMSKLKRKVMCMDGNERDEVLYCGTSTGDVLKIKLNFHHNLDIVEPVKTPCVVGCFARISKKKLRRGSVDLYQQGVRSLKRLFNGELIIGAGDGTLELVVEDKPVLPKDCADVKLPSIPVLKVMKSTYVNTAITSLQLTDEYILAGTMASEIYQINMNNFNAALILSCHTSTIYDVAFPNNFSEVFATASHDNVRVWSMTTMQELLRICVKNFTCSSVVFAHDGRSILTAWNDGVIRSFTPLTGRLMYAILNAHNKGVSALTTTSHGRLLVSGGCEGQVRLWQVSPYRQQLICTLKEHKGPISALHINKFDTEAASASTDGTCIIWDLERQCRRQILFAKTLFLCVKYFPTGVQLLTGGSDRKIAYWEVLDGCLVRELEGSPTGTINTLDISPSGEYFITGGNDQIIKMWRYQEGMTTHIGMGHSAVITSVRFSADGKHIISCSASGTIFVWKVPDAEGEAVTEKPADDNEKQAATSEHISELPTVRSHVSVEVTQKSEQEPQKEESKEWCKCPSISSKSSKSDSTRSSRCPVKAASSSFALVQKEGSGRASLSEKGSGISTPKKIVSGCATPNKNGSKIGSGSSTPNKPGSNIK